MASFCEMGVGDPFVPEEVPPSRRRSHDCAKVCSASRGRRGSIQAAVTRNVFGVIEPPLGARRLAAYMREASRRLDAQEPGALARAELEFPDPETVA